MRAGIIGAAAVIVLSGASIAMAQVQPPQDRINIALARARQVGIPVALLESKIAEGKAKGVSLERIAAAIERRESALEKASQALRGLPDADGNLSVGADAVEAGVSEAVLKAVADTAARERRNVAIAALTELVEQGISAEKALDHVRDALKRGPEALANLPAQASAQRGGSAPQEPAGARSGNRGAATEPGSPAGVPAPGAGAQAGRPAGTTPAPGRGGR